MKLVPQTDSVEILEDLMYNDYDKIRYGSEFCDKKIPNLKTLKKAYDFVSKKGTSFTYVTPPVSNNKIDLIKSHLAFLNEAGETEVVINDLGVLNLITHHRNLKPCLGRLRIYIPSRCPWPQTPKKYLGFFEKRRINKIFFQTNMNYLPTIHFFQNYGVYNIEVDWIPESFTYIKYLNKNGLFLSIHSELVPVAVSRRCHTARFLDVEELDKCNRPCDTSTFLLKQKILNIEFTLIGNTLFREVLPSRKDVNKIRKHVDEFILSINSVNKRDYKERINYIKNNLDI